jgi:guanylate kinase
MRDTVVSLGRDVRQRSETRVSVSSPTTREGRPSPPTSETYFTVVPHSFSERDGRPGDLSGFEFEDLIEDVFRTLGYEQVRQAERTADEGRDVLMEEVVDGTRDAFREEYAAMPLHEKALENKPLAAGGVLLLMVVFVGLLGATGLL